MPQSLAKIQLMKENFMFWQRVEAAAILVACVVAYHLSAASWWLFAALFLVPDLSMLGYLRGPVVGSHVYNLFHNYALALAVGLAGLHFHLGLLESTGLIWVAHIGWDRMIGYGLKSVVAFNQTHLGRVGK